MSEMTIFRQRTFQTVDASSFVDLFHAINVRFTSVISVYAHFFPISVSAGGHHASRADSENYIGVGRIALFGFSLSLDDVCQARACVGDDA
jgi:hypothetical protein